MPGALHFRDDADLAEERDLVIFALERLHDADDCDDETCDCADAADDPAKDRDDADERAADVPDDQADALVCMVAEIVGVVAHEQAKLHEQDVQVR